MNRLVATLAALAVVGVLLWFLPLFHVVRREAALANTQSSEFSAADYGKDFWKTRLVPAFDQAANAATVLTALRNDPKQARVRFGRSAGLGRAVLYVVRGRGTIVSVDDKSIGVALDADGKQTDVALQTGLLFGNTIRDATGLIHGGDFANSQQFNEVSMVLNRIVETTVLPQLKKQARVGDTIEFVGCAEVTNVPRDISPLKMVPLEVKLHK